MVIRFENTKTILQLRKERGRKIKEAKDLLEDAKSIGLSIAALIEENEIITQNEKKGSANDL